MKGRQQLESELNGLNILIEAVEAEFKKGTIDENGDYVLSEKSHLKIAVLLEQ